MLMLDFCYYRKVHEMHSMTRMQTASTAFSFSKEKTDFSEINYNSMKNKQPTLGIEQNIPLPILQRSPQCTL